VIKRMCPLCGKEHFSAVEQDVWNCDNCGYNLTPGMNESIHSRKNINKAKIEVESRDCESMLKVIKYSDFEQEKIPIDFHAFQIKISAMKFFPFICEETDDTALTVIETNIIRRLHYHYIVLLNLLVEHNGNDKLVAYDRRNAIGFLLKAAGGLATIYGFDLQKIAEEEVKDD